MRINSRPHTYLNRWIMLLLAGLMLLSIALARQGYDIASSQEQGINHLLSDYAQLISDNYGRSLISRVGFEHVYPLVRDLGQAGLLQSGTQQWPDDQANNIAMKNINYPLLAVFRFPDDDGPSVWLSGGPGDASGSDADTRSRLWWNTREEGFSQPFQILHWNMNDVSQSLVLIPATSGSDIFGLLLNPATLNQLIGIDMSTYQLLPEALADSDAIRPFVHIQVEDPDQYVLFSTSGYRDRYNTASSVIHDDYAGLFAGYSITASVERQAASLLAIGQHARTDLNSIVILMGMTLIMGCSALLLLRRERRLIAMRKDFVARVSHELRTPLTQIRMYAESILLDRLPEKAQQTKALQVIHRETQRLSHLVENVLRFSGGNGQQHLPENSPYRLLEMLEHLHEDFLPMLTARNATLDIDCEPSITTRCHRESLQQILGNLTDNALKYGPVGQIISLQASATDTKIRICITDQGPGIPARFHKQIFQPYFRLERETERAIAGTGIGLSVASELAGQLGGALQIEIVAAGGSRFCLTLTE